jgi:hypothetical protein
VNDRDASGTNKVHVSLVSLEALEAQGFWISSTQEEPEEEPLPGYEMPFAWRAAAGWL